MYKTGLIGFLYGIAEWIMRLAYTNLLWLLFSAMGLIVLGVFPATAGLYSVVRKWIIKDPDTPVWKTFWRSYRSDFVKANIIGYIFLLIGWLLFVDLKFFQAHGGFLFLLLSYIFILLLFVYMAVALFLFPVFVHFDLKPLQYLKQTFFIVVLRPLECLMAAAGCLAVYYLMLFIPGLLPFFSISTMALVTMWLASRAFTKLQIKIEEREEK